MTPPSGMWRESVHTARANQFWRRSTNLTMLLAAVLLLACPWSQTAAPAAPASVAGIPGDPLGHSPRQRAENLLHSYDAGDRYATPAGERTLRRLAGAVAVRYQPGAQPGRLATNLTVAGGVLEGYEAGAVHGRRLALFFSRSRARQESEAGARNLEARRNALKAVAGVAAADPVFVDPETGMPLAVAGEIILCLKPGLTAAAYFGADWGRVRPLGGSDDQFLLPLPGATAEEILQEASRRARDARVLWAEPDFFQRKIRRSVPNDSLFTNLWHLVNTGQHGGKPGADIKATRAWDITTGSTNVIIAILDDAVQINHPDLAPNIFSNPLEPLNSLDDDGNGYVDDLHGWNFDDDNNDPSPAAPDYDHGTCTAGLAAAAGNNGLGVCGAAQHCKILPIKFGYATDSATAQAIYYAAGRTRNGAARWRGADILSISMGWSPSSVVDTAFHWAATSGRNGKGCPIFVSSGNDADLWWPGSYPVAAGTHTFKWTYVKNSSVSEGQDAVWLDAVQFPDGTRQDFETNALPSGWTTGGNANWTSVQDGINSNHAVTGISGAGSRSVRSGTISHSQQTYIQVTKTVPAGDVSFLYWISSQYSTSSYYDHLQFLVDGVVVERFDNFYTSPVATAVGYPASLSDCIAVGASSEFDYRSDYSQYGSGLALVAPGSMWTAFIWSTDRTGTDGYNTLAGSAGDYASDFIGTSAACPIAAGGAALVLSVNTNLTATQVRSILTGTADKIGGVTYSGGWNRSYGYGRVNAAAAVSLADTNNYRRPGIALQPVDLTVPAGATALFSVMATGYPPPTYQWRLAGTNLPGQTSSTLKLPRVLASQAGEYRALATNAAGSVTSQVARLTVAPAIPLGVALNNTNLAWTSGGFGWFGQTLFRHDAASAAQSGDILDNQSSSLQTAVPGPGSISFWWRVSSQANADSLEFRVGGILATNISGEVDWNQQTFLVQSNQQIVQWNYVKDGSASAGADAGWVDEVVFRPLLATAPVKAGSTFTVTVFMVRGKTYCLDYADDLSKPVWLPAACGAGDNIEKPLVDSQATVRQRFYRIRVE